MVIAILCMLLGIAIGIRWALKITKRQSALDFMARTHAHIELEKQDKE